MMVSISSREKENIYLKRKIYRTLRDVHQEALLQKNSLTCTFLGKYLVEADVGESLVCRTRKSRFCFEGGKDVFWNNIVETANTFFEEGKKEGNFNSTLFTFKNPINISLLLPDSHFFEENELFYRLLSYIKYHTLKYDRQACDDLDFSFDDSTGVSIGEDFLYNILEHRFLTELCPMTQFKKVQDVDFLYGKNKHSFNFKGKVFYNREKRKNYTVV